MTGQKMLAALGTAELARLHANVPEYARGIGLRDEPQHGAHTPPRETHFVAAEAHYVTDILPARCRRLIVEPRQRRAVTP